jgi:uncharacterized protein YdeI (YjbR/CyaY-like superfamily)
MKPTYFPSAAAFHSWLGSHHATSDDLLVGFYKKSSGHGGLTYAEALDEALCFGWIDGIRRNAGADQYTIRFSPRKAGSIWSNVNVGHVKRLITAGRMREAGLAAFAARTAARTGIYSFEAKTPKTLPCEYVTTFREYPKAWAFLEAQAPWYRRKVIWWVVSAKQEATRQRRLAQLIRACASGRRI